MRRGMEGFLVTFGGGPILAKSASFLLHMQELRKYLEGVENSLGNQTASVLKQAQIAQATGNLDGEVGTYSFLLNFPSDPVVHLFQAAGLAVIYIGDKMHTEAESKREKIIRNLTMVMTAASTFLSPEIIKQFVHRVSADSPILLTMPEATILSMAFMGLAYYGYNIKKAHLEKKRQQRRNILGRKL